MVPAPALRLSSRKIVHAGPHTNQDYTAWMQEAFAQHGWRIELQAPQGSSLYSIVIYDYLHLSCNCT
jgi:hypothetical protein